MSAAPTLVIEHSASPWLEYTGSAEEEQAGFHIAAADKLDGMEVPALLKKDTYRGMPLLAIDRAHRKVRVNATVFGNLYRPDATRLNPGESAVVGTIRKPDAFPNMGALAEFLLRAQIVRTYAHLRAKLRKTAEHTAATSYRAEFSGAHEYYTNKRHVVNFNFAIVIDRTNGEIKVIGTAAPRAVLDVDAIYVYKHGNLSSLAVALRSNDLNAADNDDAWMLIDSLRQTYESNFLLVRALPNWACDAAGGGLQLCQDVGSELANGLAPDALPLTADNLANGSLYLADYNGRRVLPDAKAAALFREALRWTSEPYDDLLPEFAQQVSDHLKKQRNG
ncbi:MAG: hypothetical protein HYS18_02710 [Burkholderiales bacterium]|nr:hypothetical protein [Burkholderiales bacterium]